MPDSTLYDQPKAEKQGSMEPRGVFIAARLKGRTASFNRGATCLSDEVVALGGNFTGSKANALAP